jgi:hypothetical protein
VNTRVMPRLRPTRPIAMYVFLVHGRALRLAHRLA